MPGHAEAALTAYPFLGCPGTGPYQVEPTWGVFKDVFCAGKYSTFRFIEDVLDEVLTLFPSRYIHAQIKLSSTDDFIFLKPQFSSFANLFSPVILKHQNVFW